MSESQAAPQPATGDLAAANANTVAWLTAALRAGPLELRAFGTSMRPRLRPGDCVRLERRPPRRGDVALVALSERIVLHRLLRHRGSFWWVRGDARPRADGWVHEARILGVVCARHAGFGWRRLDRGSSRWLGLLGAPLLRGLRSVGGSVGVARAPSGEWERSVRPGRPLRSPSAASRWLRSSRSPQSGSAPR